MTDQPPTIDHGTFTVCESPDGAMILRCTKCPRVVIVWPGGVYEVMIQGDPDAVHSWTMPGVGVDAIINDAGMDWRERINMIIAKHEGEL